MMADSLQLNSQQDLTNLQNGCTHTSVESPPVVTTAEVSSEQSTKAESPQQPQAVTMAAVSSTVSLSTVHVQTSPSYNSRSSIPVLTHSVSEPIHNPRRTLTRSAAVTSPPPPDEQPEILGTPTMNISVDSSDSGFAGELPPRLEALARAHGQGSLSRDCSFEYTDSTGTDLVGFIVKTMKNPRDRKFLARLEQDCLLFIQDQTRLYIQYPQMTSYHRMIVHRVAAYFGMDHNVDQQTGKSVIINKTVNTRIPELRFNDLANREEGDDLEGLAPRSILRRQNTPSGDEGTPPKVDSPGAHYTMEDKRSKSIEEREEQYNKVRERIFNQDSISSQSSQSSKGDGDSQQPQILQREDFTAEEMCPEVQPTNNRIVKSKSLDSDRGSEKQTISASGIKIMTTKSLTRSSSSPGHSASRFYDRSLGQPRGGGNNSPRGSRLYPSGTPPMAPATYPFWSSEGLPAVSSLPSGEVPMGQSMAPTMSGMVPVMSSQAGGMMWAIPQESMQHGMMLINPNTGTPMLNSDGTTLIVQPAYQPSVVKPGQGASYMHQGQQQQQQPAQQPQMQQPNPNQQQQQQGSSGQQQGLPPGQMVMSQQYVGMQQPVYVVPQPGRQQYAPQQTATEAMQGGQWIEATQVVSPNNQNYQDMSGQFATMSIAMPQADMEGGVQQQYGDSGVSASTTTSGPVYVSSVNQGGATPRAVQYVMYQHPSQLPMQQVRQVMHNQPVTSHMVATNQQQVQQGSTPQQPSQTYVYGAAAGAAPFQPLYYHQQYATGKDASAVQYPHSQTPPTPPRAPSPPLPAYNQQQIGYSSPPTQQASVQYPAQTHTPPYQQQSPSQPPSQVLRPVLPVMVPAQRTVAMGTAHVTHSPVQYQAGAVQVQTQYPANQKRPYNVDRRQAKMSEMYGHDGAFVQAVPVGYGDAVGMAQGERGQYNPYQAQQSRFASQGHMTTAGAPYQPHSRQKQKSHRDRRNQSPRGGQHQEQGRKQMGSRSHSTEKDKRTAGSHVLEVYDLPSGINSYEAESLLEDLKKAGGKVRGRNTQSSDDADTTAVVQVAFSSRLAAEQALNTVTNPKFKLRLSAGGSCSNVDGHSVVASSP